MIDSFSLLLSNYSPMLKKYMYMNLCELLDDMVNFVCFYFNYDSPESFSIWACSWGGNLECFVIDCLLHYIYIYIYILFLNKSNSEYVLSFRDKVIFLKIWYIYLYITHILCFIHLYVCVIYIFKWFLSIICGPGYLWCRK